MRSLSYCLSALYLCSTLACGSSDDPKTPVDTGVTLSDGKKTGQDGKLPPSDGSTAPDSKTTTDTGGGGNLNCSGLIACMAKCTDTATQEACVKACMDQGSAEGVQLATALATCLNSAMTGSCATDCQDQTSAACQTCALNACKTEQSKCMGGTGQPIEGFGDACTPSQTDSCKAGQICLSTSAEATGFCSVSCSNPGTQCPDAPTDTLAACILQLSTSSGYYCGFLCKLQGQTFNCPTGMKCSDTEDPPNSGQFSCEPQ